jgi:hypothetical protein
MRFAQAAGNEVEIERWRHHSGEYACLLTRPAFSGYTTVLYCIVHRFDDMRRPGG